MTDISSDLSGLLSSSGGPPVFDSVVCASGSYDHLSGNLFQRARRPGSRAGGQGSGTIHAVSHPYRHTAVAVRKVADLTRVTSRIERVNARSGGSADEPRHPNQLRDRTNRPR